MFTLIHDLIPQQAGTVVFTDDIEELDYQLKCIVIADNREVSECKEEKMILFSLIDWISNIP